MQVTQARIEVTSPWVESVSAAITIGAVWESHNG
jgi:hypothetical protein